ncbi:MAG TPA: long-chain fatty acid--CoA ligase [Pseudogracilibacillus sp.]|nr:long-chain fatty acid--CoA ligase [Pseudogracilibacillus sp.]
MMDTPLSLVSVIERAEKLYPRKKIISRTHTGVLEYTYGDMAKRTRALASALEKLGVKQGDRVGTFAWNHHRHLETYFAAPAMGAVLHTINIRLAKEHISYIANHAEDKVLLIDIDLLPLIEQVKDELKTVEAFIVMSDEKTVPESSLSPLYSYEQLVADGDETYEFNQDIEENDPAGMCYTSATTGLPKGVVYSHRGIVLHSMVAGLADSLAISEADRVLPVVPMFHANAWGLPFAATWFGATQVFPGPGMTPQIIADMLEEYKVTLTAGVPTIWLGLLQVLEQGNHNIDSMRAIVCGGSAAPMEMIRKFEIDYGIPFIHAFGMTETTPLATIARLKSYQEDLPEAERLKLRATQGTLVPGLNMRVVDDEGNDVPADGKSMGELWLQGPWIADSYYNDERSADAFQDGWLKTGDVVTVDEEGFMKIVDRTGDLIKSGGEWISSVDLENGLMAHPQVIEAAVVAIPDEKWQERPAAFVVLRENSETTEEDLKSFLEDNLKFASWWLPDKVFFIDEVPKTSVGKFLKRELRDMAQKQIAK